MLILLILFIGPILDGIVLSCFWRWFAIPAFHAPQLNIFIILGLSSLLGFVTYKTDMRTHELVEKKEYGKVLSNQFVVAFTFLFYGFVYHYLSTVNW